MGKIVDKMSQKIMAELLKKGLPPEAIQNLLGSGFEDEVKSTLENITYMDKGAAEIVETEFACVPPSYTG